MTKSPGALIDNFVFESSQTISGQGKMLVYVQQFKKLLIIFITNRPLLRKTSERSKDNCQNKIQCIIHSHIDRVFDEQNSGEEEQGEIQYIFNQSESSSNSESSEIEDEEQRKIREQQIDEYEKLKADFLQFKENKFGSNNAMIKDRLEHEKKLLSTVESRRQRFIQGMKEKQHYEAYEEKVSQLKDKLKDDRIMSDKYHWLNHKLKFHVDSASAFSVVDTKQQVSDYHATELVTEDTYKLKKEKKSINKLLQQSE